MPETDIRELNRKIRDAEDLTRKAESALKEEKRLGRKRLAIAIPAVAALLIFGGQLFPGYMFDGNVAQEVKAEVQKAQVALMTTTCAEKFLAQPEGAAKVAEMKAADSWKRPDLIPAKLRTLPGEGSTDSSLSAKCVEIILSPPTTAAAKG